MGLKVRSTTIVSCDKCRNYSFGIQLIERYELQPSNIINLCQSCADWLADQIKAKG